MGKGAALPGDERQEEQRSRQESLTTLMAVGSSPSHVNVLAIQVRDGERVVA